ncbi:hypothetical protein EDB85DRAFT_1877070, partial [Lactarius pseudohatsudake]
ACYVPAASGRHLINLGSQPPDLRAIIKLSLCKVRSDAIHENAYRTVDSLPGYNRYILWSSAKSLHLISFAKRFGHDANFARVVGLVLNGRISTYRGDVKRIAASKVEGYYQIYEGQDTVNKVLGLIRGSKYLYPKEVNPMGIVTSKPFTHLAVIAILCDAYFSNTQGGSLATKHRKQFTSSLPDTHPTELEIPAAMLALVATAIHAALEDLTTGIRRKMDFNADFYEDVYLSHMKFLSHIRSGSIGKYHRLMANLFTQAS